MAAPDSGPMEWGPLEVVSDVEVDVLGRDESGNDVMVRFLDGVMEGGAAVDIDALKPGIDIRTSAIDIAILGARE